MAAELAPARPGEVTVIATGGLAPLVDRRGRTVIDAHEPWLTLVGLRLVFERNCRSPEARGEARASPGAGLGRREIAVLGRAWTGSLGQVTDDGPGARELPEQMRVRRAKLERMRAAGVDPYPVGLPAYDDPIADLRAAHPDLRARHGDRRARRRRPGGSCSTATAASSASPRSATAPATCR